MMRTLLLALLVGWLSCSVLAQQQTYFRGEVSDESGNTLQQVSIRQLSTGFLFKTGMGGRFGISSNAVVDSFYFSLEGYQPEKWSGTADAFLQIRLRLLPSSLSNPDRPRLSSRTANMSRQDERRVFFGNETYTSLIENAWINTTQYPTTGLALNVDRASYSNIRRFLNRATFVPADAVRIEEMLNYFPVPATSLASSTDTALFKVGSLLGPCPWNWDHQLLQVQVAARQLDLDTLPASHLVFLIDVSASMDMPNRLPLLQSAFRMLTLNLREKDTVSIVAYGGITAVLLRAVSGCEKDSIMHVIDSLTPGGATPGESGIRMAYQLAKDHFIENGNNRVILATDGDFNVGLRTESELDELITSQRAKGIYLTCLGVGMGNYKDSKIQLLAEKGNGNFAYIDTEREAEKIMMKEFAQTLYTVADNAYMQVSFSPNWVKQYRLIGFDNKVSALLDSLSSIEGGEMGSGNTLTALFELDPTDSLWLAQKDHRNELLAQVSLRYRSTLDTLPQLRMAHLDANQASSLLELRTHQFYAAVALFGMKLKESSQVKNYSWAQLQLLVDQVIDGAQPLQVEFAQLVAQAAARYEPKKKKRSAKRKG
ncbi:MAG: von Willebrand factor type A domain-containing protein [Sphingomonadales bacterium]